MWVAGDELGVGVHYHYVTMWVAGDELGVGVHYYYVTMCLAFLGLYPPIRVYTVIYVGFCQGTNWSPWYLGMCQTDNGHTRNPKLL